MMVSFGRQEPVWVEVGAASVVARTQIGPVSITLVSVPTKPNVWAAFTEPEIIPASLLAHDTQEGARQHMTELVREFGEAVLNG